MLSYLNLFLFWQPIYHQSSRYRPHRLPPHPRLPQRPPPQRPPRPHLGSGSASGSGSGSGSPFADYRIEIIMLNNADSTKRFNTQKKMCKRFRLT